MNHFGQAHIINKLVALIEKLPMNEHDPKNMIMHKSSKKLNVHGDFKKQTEIENNLSLLAVEGFYHDPWQLKVLEYCFTLLY